MNQDRSGGAWCPVRPISSGVREWIEVDLGADFRVTRSGTQGRYGGGQGQEYAERYILEYTRSNQSNGRWITYSNHSGHQV